MKIENEEETHMDFAEEIKNMERQELEYFLIFTMGMLSTEESYRDKTPNELYDFIKYGFYKDDPDDQMWTTP